MIPRVIKTQLKKFINKQSTASAIKDVAPISGHTNKVFCVTLENDRSIMVKTANNSWSAPRFENARRASGLIADKSDIVTPDHIPFPVDVSDKPLQIYWHISLPTLKSRWRSLLGHQKIDVVRSMGKLLRQLHDIKLEEYGTLENEEYSSDSLEHFFGYDLQMRLRPAVWTSWKEGLPLLDQLTEHAEQLSPPQDPPSLVHNDVHLDNLLCNTDDDMIRCVGLLDLEVSGGGRFESDLASAILMHDPLFSGKIIEESGLNNFESYLLEGYAKTPNPHFLLFYKLYHLLNMGFYSAYNGDRQHAHSVAGKMKQLFKEL